MAQLAIIIPLGPVEGGGTPTHPIAPGGPPPGIWPSPGYPAHPIAPGGPPPGIWPSPGYPAHPIVIPPAPGGGFPSHPIVIPPPPVGIWPSPGYPTHPIAPGGPPLGFWGGVAPPYPTHPIAPGGPPTRPTEPPSTEGDWVYSPVYGWVWMPAGSGGKPVPAPPEGGEAPPTPTPA
jgi:hypothetical protein